MCLKWDHVKKLKSKLHANDYKYKCKKITCEGKNQWCAYRDVCTHSDPVINIKYDWIYSYKYKSSNKDQSDKIYKNSVCVSWYVQRILCITFGHVQIGALYIYHMVHSYVLNKMRDHNNNNNSQIY